MGPDTNTSIVEINKIGIGANTRIDRIPTRRNIRGRCGGLKIILNMPLDIVVEIVGHMHPRDLLNLAHTSKSFRKFLMSRNAAPLWKAARRQVDGLLECPGHLSKPAYANLLFFTHCHWCLKPNVKSVLWEFNARYCSSCRDDLIANDYQYLQFILEVGGLTSFYRGYINTIQAPTTKGSNFKDNPYHRLEIAEVKDQWDALPTDDEKKAFIVERLAAVKQRKEYGLQIHQWQQSQERGRSHESGLIREGRLEAIKKRLQEEGWSDELTLMNDSEWHELRRHKAAHKAQQLTDNVWQRIRRELWKHMENVRMKRLAREHMNTVNARLTFLRQAVSMYDTSQAPMVADMDWRPFWSDYALMPAFRAPMESNVETSFTLGALLELCKAQIPQLEAEWRKERKAEFTAIFRKGTKSAPELNLPEDQETLLSLAIATFDCRDCSHMAIRWPQVLTHQCVRAVTLIQLCLSDHDKYRHAVAQWCLPHMRPWPQQVTFTTNPTLEEACAAIRACRRDPSTATFQDMEACEVWLACRTCSNSGWQFVDEYSTFDWKNVVSGAQHAFNIARFTVRDYPHTPEWVPLGPEHTFKVLQLEKIIHEKHDLAVSPMVNFGCTQCRYRGVLCEVVDHSSRAHDNENPQLGVDYYRHTDNPQYVPEPIKIYPEALRGAPGVVCNVRAGYGFVTAIPLMQHEAV
ncbi:hypothetical protein V8D89_012138 [Ganoderma adspersum]